MKNVFSHKLDTRDQARVLKAREWIKKMKDQQKFTWQKAVKLITQ